MLGKNKYFATELQEVQGKERDYIKISQGTSNVSSNEGPKKKKKNTRFVIYVSEEDAKIKLAEVSGYLFALVITFRQSS